MDTSPIEVILLIAQIGKLIHDILMSKELQINTRITKKIYTNQTCTCNNTDVLTGDEDAT